MPYLIIISICSAWLFYSYFAWYVNANLPYFGSLFSNQVIFMKALKMFSLQWSLVLGIVGLLFSFYLLNQVLHNRKNLDSKLNEGITWKIVIIFYICLTIFTIF